jgi:SET domain-containing protein 6
VDTIAEDETLFIVPKSSILSVETSIFAKKYPDIIASLDEYPSKGLLALILTILYEKAAKTESKWKAYLDVLPQSFNTLMWWSPEELKEFQGSSIVGRIDKDETDTLFCNALVPIIENNTVLFGFHAVEKLKEAVVYEAHVVASQIMSYGFDVERNEDGPDIGEDGWTTDEEEEGEGAKAMIPLADMLNADADRNNARLSFFKYIEIYS